MFFLFSVHPIANNLDQYSHLLQLRLGESFDNSTYFVSILFQVNLNCIDCNSVTKIWSANKQGDTLYWDSISFEDRLI